MVSNGLSVRLLGRTEMEIVLRRPLSRPTGPDFHFLLLPADSEKRRGDRPASGRATLVFGKELAHRR